VSADHSTAAFTTLADLAAARVGGRAIASNDDFFAPRANLLRPEPAVFVPGKFTSRGKWMDGWETRRRRSPGHDWCVVALGMRGVIRGINVDTSHFTGNHPSHCSVEAMDANRTPTASVCGAEGQPWTTILEKSPLTGNSNNLFAVQNSRPCTHVRLNIFPDGGVARLRVYGDVTVDWKAAGTRVIDLASIKNGGLVLGASDMHFGARDNMIMPGRARNMGVDGKHVGGVAPVMTGRSCGSDRRARFPASRSTRITSRETIRRARRSKACRSLTHRSTIWQPPHGPRYFPARLYTRTIDISTSTS